MKWHTLYLKNKTNEHKELFFFFFFFYGLDYIIRDTRRRRAPLSEKERM